MYKTLEDVLTKFCRRGLEQYLKAYIGNFISIAFFRIPAFRKSFIECILKKSNDDIPEWINSNWSLDVNENEEESAITHVYDWENYFYC